MAACGDTTCPSSPAASLSFDFCLTARNSSGSGGGGGGGAPSACSGRVMAALLHAHAGNKTAACCARRDADNGWASETGSSAHPAPPTRHKRRRAEAAGRAAPARGAPAVQQWPAQRMRFSLDAGLCDSAESAPPPPARGAKPGAGLASDPGVDLAPDPGADGWASVWRSLEDAARRPPFGGAGAEWRALLAAATLASDSGASSSCALGLGFGGKEVGQACGAAHAQVQVWPKPVCF